MPVRVIQPASGALARRMEEVGRAFDPRGSRVTALRAKVARAVRDDNTDKLLGRGLLEGVDRYGRTLARMADSTYRKKGRGFGPVLCPRGAASRFITKFFTRWVFDGGSWVLTAGWRDVVNDRGQSFVQYHLTGAKKPGTKWVLPKRDVGGVSPKGWAVIRRTFADWRKRGS